MIDLAEALRDELRKLKAEILAEVEGHLRALREELEPEPLPPVLLVDEACKLARISRSQFDRWLADDRSGLRALLVPVGRTWRVPTSEFLAWVLSRRGHTRAARPHVPDLVSRLRSS